MKDRGRFASNDLLVRVIGAKAFTWAAIPPEAGTRMCEVRIETANLDRDLSRVLELWRENSRTLGFLPEGAFKEYVAKGHVIAAIDETNACFGYLLFRISRQRASIVHLCVSEKHRNEGVAKRLVDALATRTRHLRGISVRCRRDFPANDLWPKLMFDVESEVPGRGKEGMPLICWYRSHNKKTLFSEATRKLQETRLTAVLDLNIVLDIVDPEVTADNIPSKALEASWLQDLVLRFVTPELGCEINRQNDDAKRRMTHISASSYHCVTADTSAFASLYNDLLISA